MANVLQIMKLTPAGIIPKQGSKLAAGLDLSSAYDVVIPARGKNIVKTDLAIAIPDGCYGRIAPRSGLAWKHFIDTGAGVIDADYRGNVGVILFNHSDVDFSVKVGDRIAQLILERIMYPEIKVVEQLTDTERGAGGLGSTGVQLKIETSAVSGMGDAKRSKLFMKKHQETTEYILGVIGDIRSKLTPAQEQRLMDVCELDDGFVAKRSLVQSCRQAQDLHYAPNQILEFVENLQKYDLSEECTA